MQTVMQTKARKCVQKHVAEHLLNQDKVAENKRSSLKKGKNSKQNSKN